MTVKLNVCMNGNPTEEAVVNEIISAYPELKGIAPESIKMKVNNSLTYTDDYTRYSTRRQTGILSQLFLLMLSRQCNPT